MKKTYSFHKRAHTRALIFLVIPSLFALSCNRQSEVNAPSSVLKIESDEASMIKHHYAKIVYANYQDSLKTAVELEVAIDKFLKAPTEIALGEAKSAWLQSRKPYGESESYRFYAGPIDDDNGPEGLLNAWPLDESYIESGNSAFKGILEDKEKYSKLTEELLISLNEKEGEENISTGYHAIEFMLWGVDESAETAGQRLLTDFTDGPLAQRRADFLKIVAHKLVKDLEYLVLAWQPNSDNYRKSFEALDNKVAFRNILNGIGMLSGFELARERIDVPLNTKSQEDEHSCFSDNTHNDILHNAVAVRNVFEGEYNGVYYSVEKGASVKMLFSNGAEISKVIQKSVDQAKNLKAPFDQLILESNPEGRKSVQDVMETLVSEAKLISKSASAIGVAINIEE